MSDLKPVLYAEDDENDAFLLQTAFRRAAIAHPLLIARDGADAMQRLGAEKGCGPLPSLVITDLKMPRLDGFSLLAWARTQPHLNGIPFVVLTSSSHAWDTRRAQELAVAEFITKPGDFGEWLHLANSLAGKWLRAAAALPSPPAPGAVNGTVPHQ